MYHIADFEEKENFIKDNLGDISATSVGITGLGAGAKIQKNQSDKFKKNIKIYKGQRRKKRKLIKELKNAKTEDESKQINNAIDRSNEIGGDARGTAGHLIDEKFNKHNLSKKGLRVARRGLGGAISLKILGEIFNKNKKNNKS